MSATLDVKPLDEIRDRLLRDHIRHGYVDSTLDETHREITVFIDNLPDLQQCAANLRLQRWTSLVQRWHGWHGEVWLVLSLEIPRGVFPGQGRRAA